ncbi:MAG: 1-(5-phosphoribosyl)-5-[(5-phosphoribosylamino)methylideneamino]imidazole-4-carboxamide isomerase [Anaerovoracaceae bacterium]|jgi:phosphoribosylformimino-5-aminoimidazole carboxamide ribotide isomerase
MKIFPAVDLSDGKVVRLLNGDYSKMTVYSEDPLETAEQFEDAGAEYLHVVDLDGAKDGSQPNFSAVRGIIENTGLKVEIGGGIRDEQIIVDYAKVGALRVIIGTMAIKDPEFTQRMIARHKDSVAVGVDISGARVAIDGWTNLTNITVDDMLEDLIEKGVGTVICTDIRKDGALGGTNLALYRNLVRDYGGYVDIIASGGISTLEDLDSLQEIGVDGAIIGKALYTGALDLEEVIKEFQD